MKRLLSLVAIAFLLLITSAVFADDYSKDENLTLSVSFIEQGLDVSLEGWRTDPTDQSKFFVKEQYYAEDRNGDGVVDSVQHLSVKRSGVFLTYYVHSNVVQEKFPKHTFFDKEVGDIPDNRIVKVKRCRQQYVCVNSFNVYKNFFQNTREYKPAENVFSILGIKYKEGRKKFLAQNPKKNLIHLEIDEDDMNELFVTGLLDQRL